MKESALRREGSALTTLLWCGVGLLVPRATLLGALAPFGMGLAACGGAANLPTLLCLGVGYLLAGTVRPARYLLTVAVVVYIGAVLLRRPKAPAAEQNAEPRCSSPSL